MALRNYICDGIVLSRINYSEADRIVKIFSREHGKITLLAKGVRRPKSRKRSALEIFCHSRFLVAKSKGLDLLREVEPIEVFIPTRKSLARASLAYFFIEVIDKFMHEGERNEYIFDLLLNYLRKVQSNIGLKKIRKEFIYDVLVALGFWPAGKPMEYEEAVLEDVLSQSINTIRVGKSIFSNK